MQQIPIIEETVLRGIANINVIDWPGGEPGMKGLLMVLANGHQYTLMLPGDACKEIARMLTSGLVVATSPLPRNITKVN